MTTTPKGPTMPDQPDLRAPVTLECQLTIDGRTYVTRQHVSRALWDDDPAARVQAEDMLRRRLGEYIARELAPPVRVVEASPGGEALWARLMTETEN
ncbi:hypothetical protein ACFZDM_33480 [Streptomyces californicus]|uniref:hypothetical protein n=1 Tax=Streptomyces californicus TaxID=67351 RepID=UPI0036E06187